jgi:hypothetical protein
LKPNNPVNVIRVVLPRLCACPLVGECDMVMLAQVNFVSEEPQSDSPIWDISPATVRLTYTDALVVAVVEPLDPPGTSLIIQYTVNTHAESDPELWCAMFWLDQHRRWRIRVPSKDESFKAAIASVCHDVLRALFAEGDDQAAVVRGSHSCR